MTRAFSIRDGAGIAAGAVALHYMLEQYATAIHVPAIGAMLVGAAALIAVPAIAARGDWQGRLALALPARRYLIAALLIGLTSWTVIGAIERPIFNWLGADRRWDLEARTTVLWQSLLVIGVLGPIGEEIAFRGVFARSLATVWSWRRAMLVSSVMFALYHHSLHQLFGPLLFGLVTSYLALRSRSVLPGILVHMLTNVIVTFANYDVPPALWDAHAVHYDAWLIVSSLATLGGLWIAGRGDP
jgi:membrane protease YdiL (CAAX protease family)